MSRTASPRTVDALATAVQALGAVLDENDNLPRPLTDACSELIEQLAAEVEHLDGRRPADVDPEPRQAELPLEEPQLADERLDRLGFRPAAAAGEDVDRITHHQAATHEFAVSDDLVVDGVAYDARRWRADGKGGFERRPTAGGTVDHSAILAELPEDARRAEEVGPPVDPIGQWAAGASCRPNLGAGSSHSHRR